MTPELSAAIASFLEKNPHYANPDEVAGNCFHFSVEFQEHLFELGLIDEAGRESFWDVVEVDVVDGREVPPVNQHWVFRYDNVMIDWTARQFWEDVSVPVVWEL